MNRGAYDNTVEKADLTTGKTASIFPAVLRCPSRKSQSLPKGGGGSHSAGEARESATSGAWTVRTTLAAAGIQFCQASARREQPLRPVVGAAYGPCSGWAPQGRFVTSAGKPGAVWTRVRGQGTYCVPLVIHLRATCLERLILSRKECDQILTHRKARSLFPAFSSLLWSSSSFCAFAGRPARERPLQQHAPGNLAMGDCALTAA